MVRHQAVELGAVRRTVQIQLWQLSALPRIQAGKTLFGDGVSQIMPDGTVRNYHANVIGDAAMMAVHDIQIDTTTKTLGQNVKHNRVIISFEGGVVGIHQTVDPTTTP